jgi:hypothetical protein
LNLKRIRRHIEISGNILSSCAAAALATAAAHATTHASAAAAHTTSLAAAAAHATSLATALHAVMVGYRGSGGAGKFSFIERLYCVGYRSGCAGVNFHAGRGKGFHRIGPDVTGEHPGNALGCNKLGSLYSSAPAEAPGIISESFECHIVCVYYQKIRAAAETRVDRSVQRVSCRTHCNFHILLSPCLMNCLRADTGLNHAITNLICTVCARKIMIVILGYYKEKPVDKIILVA